MTDWAIPQQAKLKYTQLFNLHDRSRSGFLSGVQCRDILMQSGLPRNILAEIWNLSDIDGDGQLTREEFILAMHLTNQVRAGQTLPVQLSPDLIPPSYRRQRAISTTSVHSATSATSSIGSNVAASSIANDDQAAHKSAEIAGSSAEQGSILNSNSFEDKRRENFERGRAELERRRLKIIEQQTSIVSEQLVRCQKQVAEAKSKIDAMRTERDTKAGFLTSLEAQLKTVRDRKAFLDHEEVQIIAIAKDLNLVNSIHSADLDQQATHAKLESISQMKDKLVMLSKEKEDAIKESTEAQARLDELKKELKAVGEEASELYSNYKEQIAKAKVLKLQFAEESRSKLVDLDSAWGATATSVSSPPPNQQQSSFKAQPTEPTQTLSTATEDPWASSNKQFSSDPFAESNNNISSTCDSFNAPNSDTGAKSNDQSSPFGEGNASDAFNHDNSSGAFVTILRKKMYKAIYAFDARNVDELTINPGDIIIGSEEVCEPGWLSGKIDERCGLFPEAYVEPLPDEESFSPAIENALNTPKSPSFATNISGQQDSAPFGSNQSAEPVQQRAASPMSAVVKYKVVYAFEARNVDELNMNPGDIITGVEGQHEPGWLMGELNGQRGLFPEAYVEKLAESQIEQTNTTTSEQTGTLRRGSSSGSLRSKKSRAKKAEVATVIANYRALGQEQLNLEKGQLILVRRKMDSGWWEGELQVKDDQAAGRIVPNSRHKQAQPRTQRANELDHLIGELIGSELDFINDLRLCQTSYILPLSKSFDVTQIFRNWPQLIAGHSAVLTQANVPLKSEGASRKVDYLRLFKAYNEMLVSMIETYVGFCSRQNESTRQLEAMRASDVRFKQLVSESQRSLRRMIEPDLESAGSGAPGERAERARASRNANLPVTSFLIKPMQRITKYELLFDRMLKVACESASYAHLQTPIQRVKESAQALCQQVNEACRLRENDLNNSHRLQWCQRHIKRQSSNATQLDNLGPRSSFGRSSMSSVDLRLSSSMSLAGTSSEPQVELVQFDSETNCLGRRRLIKAGCLFKLRSGRELVAFLFNDFLLLTQVKGGASLRVVDIFGSERAQQAYYKFYRPPILLEDIQFDNFDNEQLFQSLSCPSINSSMSSSAPTKEQENLMISFLDRQSGCVHNLIALTSEEKACWIKLLSESVAGAQATRASLVSKRAPMGARPLGMEESLARLFVTVLELTRITSSPAKQRQTSLVDMNQSWERKLSSRNQMEAIQSLCIVMQMRRHKRAACHVSDDERESDPLSHEFKTNPVTISDSGRQPVMADMNESMSNLEVQRDKYKFENDSTQFLVADNQDNGQRGQTFLDIELIDDSRFRRTSLIALKRISMTQLMGFEAKSSNSLESTRRVSNSSSRSIPALQPNRPVDMTLKLRPASSEQTARNQSSPSSSLASRSMIGQDAEQKFYLKLRFHLQLFCDIPSLT